MATVYLAEDLKHGRKVAIKVLHPELSAVIGGERFLSEIKTTASLQHPHILGLIDSGEADGLLYYVMPFIEGETLRARLTREKQLPVEDAIRLTKEVASALEFAHKRGIVHRDIKPENILLQDGQALVADFGIALAVQQAGGSRMTQTGMSLGTPAYMSPEQAMGERDIGARSDVYALGAMAYEMLAGEPPFMGPNSQAIVAKVLTEPAPLLRPKRPTVSPAVEHAVLTALQKLPADRFGSAKEFADALDGKGGTYASTVAISATRLPRPPRLPRPVLLAGSALILTAAVAAGWLAHGSSRARATFAPIVSRYQVMLPDSAAAINPATGSAIAIAPDGSVFAYMSRSGLMLRYSDRVDPVSVPGGRRGTAPFFSPDGQWLGFQDGARLVKVPLAGGATVSICDSCVGYSHSWGDDDTVRYHSAAENSANIRVLMAVSGRGGVPREFAVPDTGSGESFRQPVLLPGRRTVLFAIYTGSTSRLASLDLKTGAVTRFDQAGFTPKWVEQGFVVLGSADGSLIALPFDAARARPTGAPVTIARDVLTPDPLTGSRAAVAASGAIVFPLAGASLGGRLVLVSRSGEATPLAAETRAFGNPRISPGGDRIAVAITDSKNGAGRDVWVLNVAQRAWSRMTTDGISDRPIWTPDGRRIVYSSNSDLWWIASDGSGHPDSLFVENGSHTAGSVTPDGRSVVFLKEGSLSAGIRALAFDAAPAARMVIPARFNETAPTLSPDGHWLAYQSDEAGRNEVYVRPYPGPGGQVPVSLSGGTEPVWSRSGRELFFRSGDTLMVASVTLSPAFDVTERHPLFTSLFLSSAKFPEYDVTPDGRHFVMIRGGEARSPLIALSNVFDRLVHDRRGMR